MTLVVAAALLVVVVVAVLVLYLVLDQVGVFDSLNSTAATITGTEEDGGGIQFVFSAGKVVGFTAVLGAVYVVLVTALATLGAPALQRLRGPGGRCRGHARRVLSGPRRLPRPRACSSDG